MLRILNKTKGTVLAEKAELAGTWFKRLKGLIGRDSLPENGCLILNPCNSVHTCFMKFNIDILFISKTGEVIYLMEDVPPFRFSPVVKGARYVIELPRNTISSTSTGTGDRVNIP